MSELLLGLPRGAVFEHMVPRLCLVNVVKAIIGWAGNAGSGMRMQGQE
jgi:hypothetical protein